tara:strand:- start:1207 stop:2169 length:963 start_codon:yes stop_codon:yes gene_type:complete
LIAYVILWQVTNKGIGMKIKNILFVIMSFQYCNLNYVSAAIISASDGVNSTYCNGFTSKTQIYHDTNTATGVIKSEYLYNASEQVIETPTFDGSWVAKSRGTNCIVDSNNFNGSSYADTSFNAYTGESKLFATAEFNDLVNVSTGIDSYSETYMSVSLVLNNLTEDTQFFLDLNVEGDFNYSGLGSSSYHKQADIISDGNFTRYAESWYSTEGEHVNYYERLFVDIKAGVTNLTFILRDYLSASAVGGNGAGKSSSATANFTNTSWFNFGFTSEVEYTLDLPELLTTPRPNINMNEVPEPSTLILLALGIIGASYRKFKE